MALTETATPQQAKAEPEAPKQRWWTPRGDTGRKALRNAEISTEVLREGEDNLLTRHVAYHRDQYLALLVPEHEGYVYNLSKDEQTGSYFLLVEKQYWKLAEDPGEAPLPALPAHLAGLEGEELKRAVAVYMAKVERGMASLRRHAIKRGMCSTFDQIMEHAGFDGRPARYRITFGVEIEKKITEEEGRSYFANFVSFVTEPVVRLKTQVKVEMDLTSKPKAGQTPAELNLSAMEQARIADHFEAAGTKLTKAQLVKVTVATATKLTDY